MYRLLLAQMRVIGARLLTALIYLFILSSRPCHLSLL